MKLIYSSPFDPPSRWARHARRRIVAVDGEGVTRPDGAHDYTLLASSEGASVEHASGLDTETCLRFLLDIRDALVVAFAFSYDANKILRDVRYGQLRRLHAKGVCFWKGPSGAIYRIEWTPRKCFRVSDVVNKKCVRTVTVWDTFGFYQCGFVKALRAWKIGTPDEWTLLDSMKGKRADFVAVDPAAVRAYNDLECRLLVDLTTALRETVEHAGFRLSRWDGAGALASAMLRQHNVKRHKSDWSPPDVLNAYFGGRIQVCQLGEIEGPVYGYDVNSAYPSVAVHLPSLRDGQWHRSATYVPDQVAVWRCRWRLQDREWVEHPSGVAFFKACGAQNTPVLTPFPVRDDDDTIHYPITGEGWYWGPLVDVAKAHFPIEVIDGWTFVARDDTRPFRFVRDVYARRAVYKRQADPRHIVLKLGLNALYGKLAQGVGWRGTAPPYTDYVWAGFITALTQARLLGAAVRQPDSVVCFATDGLYTRRPLDLPTGSDLGEWEASVYDRMLIFQPGLYVLYQDGKPVHRTRGYFPDEIEWERMRAAWRAAGPFATHSFDVSRFLTLGVALHSRDFGRWGRWVDSRRDLNLRPSVGAVGAPTGEHAVRWEPDYALKGGGMSRPYTPKRTTNESEQDIRRSWDEDQPVPLV